MGILSWSFWFNSRPEPLSSLSQNGILVFAVLMVAMFIIIKIITGRKQKTIYYKFWLKLASFGLTNAILGFLFWFFSFEMIPMLSAKFLLALWGIMMIIWTVFLIKYLRRIPKRREIIQKEKEFKKYIP
jgi:drug/metabolite transporter (DMT)-like permease